jgi:hypothetical protein
MKNHVNAEPDFRSGSRLALNLDPNHGSVLIGSGSNHGSEPDLSITNGAACERWKVLEEQQKERNNVLLKEWGSDVKKWE